MFIHDSELSLAQAGGGPDLVGQVQPGRDHEICQKVFPARLIKGGAPIRPDFQAAAPLAPTRLKPSFGIGLTSPGD